MNNIDYEAIKLFCAQLETRLVLSTQRYGTSLLNPARKLLLNEATDDEMCTAVEIAMAELELAPQPIARSNHFVAKLRADVDRIEPGTMVAIDEKGEIAPATKAELPADLGSLTRPDHDAHHHQTEPRTRKPRKVKPKPGEIPTPAFDDPKQIKVPGAEAEPEIEPSTVEPSMDEENDAAEPDGDVDLSFPAADTKPVGNVRAEDDFSWLANGLELKGIKLSLLQVAALSGDHRKELASYIVGGPTPAFLALMNANSEKEFIIAKAVKDGVLTAEQAASGEAYKLITALAPKEWFREAVNTFLEWKKKAA
jgi:hypothetical protein